MHTLETKKVHQIGRVSVVVKHILDTDADYSDLGEFCGYQEPSNAEEKLVHISTGSVLDHKGIWRDERGRIVAAPESYPYSREWEYTFHNNGHEKIKYALQDSKRIQDLNNGYWNYFGIVAEVHLNGVEIGDASCWGFASDDTDYIKHEERNIAREALTSARTWLYEVRN